MVWKIEQKGENITIYAGNLKREINLNKNNLNTSGLYVNDKKISKNSRSFDDLKLRFTLANPNERPKGIKDTGKEAISQKATETGGTDTLDTSQNSDIKVNQKVKWDSPVNCNSNGWNNVFDQSEFEIQNNSVLFIFKATERTSQQYLKGVSIEVKFEIYENFPVIRKFVKIQNSGDNWIKVDNMIMESIALSGLLTKKTALTPSERGANTCLMAFGNHNNSIGIILASEVPSALRLITKKGVCGYNPKHFEWVIGPNEFFETEPVFYYGFSGKSHKTISGYSNSLDRAVESNLREFYEKVLKIAANPDNLPAPVWCTWSNMSAHVNDSIVRKMADIAEKCGFKTLQIDAGWSNSQSLGSWSAGSAEYHPEKFPNFKETCDYVLSKNMRLGLWVSCFRELIHKDLRDMPDARSLPLIKREYGYAMSFASPWREYFANDVISLNKKYGASYFKQDLTNMKYGDIAEGHESRTLKESKLRALRGYLESQSIINQYDPSICTLLSHEIYWGTPGVPCDLAAIKHCWTFHIPPNDYSGAHPRSKRVSYDSPKLINYPRALLAGCTHSRMRNYKHRGLPLYTIEYYGAATVNVQGSLSKEIQDRQICSWLMGAPTVYAGDLESLTDENIAHYRKRFDLLKRLQEQYGIYRYYQYSGVPKPDSLDLRWTWWGKINPEKGGVVVVCRGRLNPNTKKINIPWVSAESRYKVTKLFDEKECGEFSGKELQSGVISLNLPKQGQEILEISKI